MDYDLAIFTNIPVTDGIQTDLGLEIIDYSGKIKIFKSYSNYEGKLEDVIFDFLQKVESKNGKIFSTKTLLQVGAYYSLEDSVVFSVRLSSHCLTELGRRLLDIDICGYPCSE